MEKVLPKGWVETELGDVISLMKNGGNFKQEDIQNDNYYPISRIETIWNEEIDLSRVKYGEITDNDLEKYSLKIGDILLSHINSDKHLGKTAIYKIDVQLIHGINLLLLRTETNVLPDYVNYYFRNHRFKGGFLEIAQRSVNQSSINQKKLSSISFPLPPLAEQERIVAKLDALFKKISLIEDKITALKDLKNKFFAAIFFNNSGNTTLEGLIEECKGRVGKDWKEYPKIGVSAKDGIIDLATGLKDTFENYKVVMPGDIIYNTMRINIGSIAIYNGEVPAITSPDYVVLRTKGISNHLFLNFIKSDLGRINLSSVTTGSVRSRLYFKNLITLSYPIIDDKKQLQADNILKWFDGTIKSLDLLSKNKLSFFKKSLLHKAFKGELVPQLPTDGDAKDLLTEITALKKESNGKRGKR